MYVPSQWKFTLHCNTISHWLGAYTEWTLNTEDKNYSQTFPCKLVSSLRFVCHWRMTSDESRWVAHILVACFSWSGGENFFLLQSMEECQLFMVDKVYFIYLQMCLLIYSFIFTKVPWLRGWSSSLWVSWGASSWELNSCCSITCWHSDCLGYMSLLGLSLWLVSVKLSLVLTLSFNFAPNTHWTTPSSHLRRRYRCPLWVWS